MSRVVLITLVVASGYLAATSSAAAPASRPAGSAVEQKSRELLAKKWFDDDDVPHYGFYRHRDHTMLMNVGTGTGTLVHELTHALIAPDFPNVPDWFNEGFASLYEQCSLGPDTITGHENWRLP